MSAANLPQSFFDFFHSLVTRGLERFGLFYGIYRGSVVANEDPEVLGRIRVKVPAIFGDQESEAWAWPCAPAGVDSGFFDVPAVDDAVWVTFEMGNPRYPVYMGGWWGAPGGHSEVPFTARRPKPEVKVWKTKAGHRIELDERDGKQALWIVNPDGSYLVLDAEAREFRERIEGSHKSQAKGDREETTAKNTRVYTGGNASEKVVGDSTSHVHGNRQEATLLNRFEGTKGQKAEWVGQTSSETVFGEKVEVAIRGRQTIIGLGWNISVAGPVTLSAAGPITIIAPLGLAIAGNVSVTGTIDATGAIHGGS